MTAQAEAAVGARPTVLVAGALGVVGRAALEAYESLPEWEVVAVSRRAPDFTSRARWLALDLTDAAACAAAAKELAGVTHLVYAALHEEKSLVEGWTASRQIQVNLAMLRNLVLPLQEAAPGLRHITLLQGNKAYGVHHGPYKIPAKESDPRFIASNFYYEQEDFLRAECRPGGWSFTVLRPQIVCGFAVGNPMNAITAIGVYAAICRELEQPLRFTGGAPCFQEAVDAGLLARAILWAGSEPRCAGQIYNIANGDCFSWPTLWPRIARQCGLEVGPPHPCLLRNIMPDKAAVWDRIVARHGLKPYRYEQIVHSWDFLDYLFRAGETQPRHSILSTVKARQHGFHDCVDSEEMFVGLLARLQRERVLPPA